MRNESKKDLSRVRLGHWRRRYVSVWLAIAASAAILDSIAAAVVGAPNLDAVIAWDFVAMLLLALVARGFGGARVLLVWLMILGLALVAALAILSTLLGVGEVNVYWAQAVFGVVTLWAVLAPAVTSHLSLARALA